LRYLISRIYVYLVNGLLLLAVNSLISLHDLGRHAFLWHARHGCMEGVAGAEEEEKSGRGAAKVR
jgi:hypothetical protein